MSGASKQTNRRANTTRRYSMRRFNGHSTQCAVRRRHLRFESPFRSGIHDVDVGVAVDVAVGVGGVALEHRRVGLLQIGDNDDP